MELLTGLYGGDAESRFSALRWDYWQVRKAVVMRLKILGRF